MNEIISHREAAFYFFTGTGNSYRVTAWIADAAADAGATVTVRPIGSAHPSKEIGKGETALLGLVMPTYYFTAPWPMLRFALRLPRCSSTHAVIVATRGGLKIGPVFTPGIEGTATYLIALILALKGYRIRGATGIDMPASWIALHPGLPPDTVAAILARAKDRVDGFIGVILSGKRRFTGWLSLLFGLYCFNLSFFGLLLGRFFLPKLFFASDRCTGCGICAEHCPDKAIRIQNSGSRRHPYWTSPCEGCGRCMVYCPNQAVEASHLLAMGSYLLAGTIPTTALLAWLAARIPALAFLSRIDWALISIWATVALNLVYPLFHFLLRIRWVNRLFTLTTPTHYYRRYHEPETMLKDLG
jgi:Pyruvate/2-oxoacid:ferredoxin oxidoreductase delta subunit